MTDTYADLVSDVENALSYAGFNAVSMREKLIASMGPEDIAKIISIYVMTGSSISAKVSGKKVADLEASKDLMKFLKDKKVFGKKVSLDSFTLSRIALTFPVAVIKVRSMMKKLIPKIDTSTPLELQDLCLNSYVEEPRVESAKDFIEKFSFILAKAADKDVTQVESNSRVLLYRKIGSDGYKIDVVGQALFKVDWKLRSLEDILNAYGYASSPVSSPALPSSKLDRKNYADLNSADSNFWKVIGYSPAVTGTPDKKRKDKEALDLAVKTWVDAGT